MYKKILIACVTANIVLLSFPMANGSAWPADSSSDASNRCCICFEPVNSGQAANTLLIFGCNHIMHNQCLTQWILTNRAIGSVERTSCPICRAHILLPLNMEIPDEIRNAVSVQANFSETLALSIAVINRYFAVSQLLIGRGADVNIALVAVLNSSNFEAAQWLIGNGADADFALIRSLSSNKFAAAQWLIDHGANATLTLATELHLGNFGAAAQWLIDHGANVNVALAEEAHLRDFEAAQWLIDRGANINTASAATSFLGDVEATQWLTDHGAAHS